MKSNLTRVSIALLSAVVILGCQDQGSGPVGLDGLSPQFAKVKNCDPPNPHPSCKPAEDDAPRFNVIMEVNGTVGAAQTGRVHNDPEGILMDNFRLDLTFLTGIEGLTCGSSGPIQGGLAGETIDNAVFKQISGGDGSDGFFNFLFFHEEIRHNLWLSATITEPANWLPTSGENTMTDRDGDDGRWSVTPSGRGHKNGCTGQGVDVFWTATVLPI